MLRDTVLDIAEKEDFTLAPGGADLIALAADGSFRDAYGTLQKVMMASLDHAVWFHRAFRADEWLLYAQDSPSGQGARGFCRGSILSRDGVLVASVAQEGLIRERTPR